MIDLLFSRYAGATDHVLHMEFELGVEVINKAIQKKREEEMYQRWIIGRYEREMNFSDFKKKLIGTSDREYPAKEMTEKEIFAKVRKILEMRRE